MKSLDVSPKSHLYSYCLWWRHRDGSDRFRHWVNADSITDAIDRSRVEISIALGTNAGLWEIEDPRTQVSQQPEIDDESCTGNARYTADRVCMSCVNLFLLCLVLFAFYCWISRSAGPEQRATAPSAGISVVITSGQYHTRLNSNGL
jgi:hypothetical protein